LFEGGPIIREHERFAVAQNRRPHADDVGWPEFCRSAKELSGLGSGAKCQQLSWNILAGQVGYVGYRLDTKAVFLSTLYQ